MLVTVTSKTQWRCVLEQDYLANEEMEKGTVQDVKRRWALLRMKPDNGKTEAGKHWLGINMCNVVNTGRILKSEKVFSVEFLWFTLLRYEIQQPAHPQVDHTICCITVKLKSIKSRKNQTLSVNNVLSLNNEPFNETVSFKSFLVGGFSLKPPMYFTPE